MVLNKTQYSSGYSGSSILPENIDIKEKIKEMMNSIQEETQDGMDMLKRLSLTYSNGSEKGQLKGIKLYDTKIELYFAWLESHKIKIHCSGIPEQPTHIISSANNLNKNWIHSV